VTGIAAPPGVGKTTFSFQLAIAFAMDLPLGAWTPVAGGGGKVWLYNGEEPEDELKRRFLAACSETGVQPQEAARHLSFNSGLRERLTLVRVDPASGDVVGQRTWT
jgi:RecA-family ATPase